MKLNQFKVRAWVGAGVSAALLSGCAGWLPNSGPSYSAVGHGELDAVQNSPALSVRVVDVNEDVLAQLPAVGGAVAQVPDAWRTNKPNLILGAGDGVQVSIFEAPPAVLLSSAAAMGGADLSIGGGSGVMNLPDQVVSARGTIVVPFAGEVPVAGNTLSQVEQIIRSRLSKIANQPQVVARLTQNASNSVVVLGDGRSLRMPLTAKGERLLDVVPLAGDAKKVKNTSVRLTRGGVTRSFSATELSQNPQTNVFLQPNDVVAVLQDPYKVTMLGATNANAALDFGDDGLTVAEAIGRVAGLNDFRADPRGVYVFRRSEASLGLAPSAYASANLSPTVFRLDMRDARGMVLAQNFRLRDRDMVYVPNAPSVQLQKVLGIFNSALGSAANTATSINAFD